MKGVFVARLQPNQITKGDIFSKMANSHSTQSDLPFQNSFDKPYPVCVYCGDYFQCRDHTIPISYSQTYRDYKPGSTVKSCSECNNALGGKPLFTTTERAEYLLEWYQKRRKKYIEFPDWSDDEVDEMGYNIRVMVIQRRYLKQLYLAKLHNLELTSVGFSPRRIREFRDEKFRYCVE